MDDATESQTIFYILSLTRRVWQAYLDEYQYFAS